MKEPRFVPLPHREDPSPEEIVRRATEFRRRAERRRTVRDFSPEPVPRAAIEECLRAAGTAPSGANMQPWRFVAVSDQSLKRRIRQAAEDEERRFYRERAPADWLDALAPLGTDERKPFLEVAPWLIAIFARSYGLVPDPEEGEPRKVKHYYVTESVGIATGILITALHRSGLATLTHTPSPMGFLNELLGRPDHERPFLLLVVGRAAEDAKVPDIGREPLEEIATFL